MFRILLLSIFLMILSVPSQAQFIGLRIGIPANNNFGAITGGGGIPSGTLQDDSGHYLQDDSGHYLTGS